jgi:hypothetical protein
VAGQEIDKPVGHLGAAIDNEVAEGARVARGHGAVAKLFLVLGKKLYDREVCGEGLYLWQ